MHLYPEIYIPENLYLIGTVNMDETTFPFSKKVLDRANTIEFSYVDLVPDFEEVQDAEACEVTNDFLKSEYIVLKKDVDVEDQNFVIKICSQLQSINEILQEANSHVGYRVRDEIVFYMLNNKKSGLLAENEAMDNEIMQKILPRIQGSGISVKELLIALFKNFAGDYSGISQDSVWRQMDKYIKDKKNWSGKMLDQSSSIVIDGHDIKRINIEAAGVCEEFDDCADAAVYNLNIAPVFFEQTD